MRETPADDQHRDMKTPDKTHDPDAFNQFEADGWEHRAEGYHGLAAGLTTRVIERLLDAGETPPVYLSANVPGGDDHNHALEERYEGRIRRTA